MSEAKSERRVPGWVLLGLGWLVFSVPFWGKALHIDDGAYVHLSTLYEWNPLDAHQSEYVYLGIPLGDLWPYESTKPFGVPYLIKVVRALCGTSEVALHAAFSLFTLLFLVALRGLARALVPRARAPDGVLLFFFWVAPAFLVTSHGVMTDVPTLALVTAAAWRYVRAAERGSTPGSATGSTPGSTGAAFSWGAAAFLLAALCCDYKAALLAPALGIYTLARRRLGLKFFLSVALPGAVFGLWLLLVYQRYEIFLFKSSAPESGFSMSQEVERALGEAGGLGPALAAKFLATLSTLGGALGLLLAARARLAGGVARRAAVWVGISTLLAPGVIAVLNVSGTRRDYGAIELVFLCLCAGAGALALLDPLRSSRGASGDDGSRALATRLFLGTWLATYLLFNLALLPFAAARSQLFLMVPIAISIWAGLPWPGASGWKRVAGPALVAAGLALASGVADWQHAGSYRRVANDLGRELESGEATGLWFIAEWGMRHYMAQNGGRYLLREVDAAEVGDWVVLPRMHQRFSWPPPGLSSRVDKIETIEYAGTLPLQVFSGRSQTGFWAHAWGFLPFAFSRAPNEVFEIYRVSRPRSQ